VLHVPVSVFTSMCLMAHSTLHTVAKAAKRSPDCAAVTAHKGTLSFTTYSPSTPNTQHRAYSTSNHRISLALVALLPCFPAPWLACHACSRSGTTHSIVHTACDRPQPQPQHPLMKERVGVTRPFDQPNPVQCNTELGPSTHL
jgi:hypothetical protein